MQNTKVKGRCRYCTNSICKPRSKRQCCHCLSRVAKNIKKYVTEKRRWVISIKNVPCTDCKIKLPPEVMELDHVRGKKLFEIGARLGNVSWERLETEVAKCDVRCPNCHKLRHYYLARV